MTADNDTNVGNSITEEVPNPKDNIDRNDNEKDDEKLTDVLPGEDDPVDCEERELGVSSYFSNRLISRFSFYSLPGRLLLMLSRFLG